MVITDEVYELVKQKGPVVPSAINKLVNQNILTTSAILSELVSRGKLKISSVKMGGSPFYYAPGQEHLLEGFIHHLDEKDQRTFHQLKESRIIRDKAESALTRYSLRQLKDFAVPLSVRINDQEELFWKYNLLPDSEVETHIRSILSSVPQPESLTPPQGRIEPLPMIQGEVPRILEDTPPSPPAADAEKKIMEGKRIREHGKTDHAKSDENITTEFYANLHSFFASHKVHVESETLIKKDKEYEFILTVQSSLGEIHYYCQAKNKKKITDADLHAVDGRAQNHKLPGLLLVTGELSKSALETHKALKGLLIKQLH